MNEQITDVERVFMAFADKTRLQLLYLLRDGEVSVTALCEELKTSQPKVSRHLAYLRAMDMVSTRRDGKSIYYKLHLPSSSFGASVVEETIDWLGSISGSARSRRRSLPLPKPHPAPEQPSFTYNQPTQSYKEPEPQYAEPELEIYLL